MGSRKTLHPTFPAHGNEHFQHEEGEDGSSMALYLRVDTGLGCTPRWVSALPFLSAGHASVLGSWGALRHPDLGG